MMDESLTAQKTGRSRPYVKYAENGDPLVEGEHYKEKRALILKK